MLSSDQQTELRVNRDLASRTHDGLWGHPACLLLVSLTTSVFPDHPVWMSIFAALFVAQTGMRIRLIRRLEKLPFSAMRTWRSFMMFLLMGSGLLWGVLVAWACVEYGFQDQNSYLLLLYHAAISVVGAEMFLHDRRLGQWYLAGLFFPVMVVNLVSVSAQSWGPVCAFSFYIVFLTTRLQRLCAAYAARLEETRDLEATARRDSLTGLLNRTAMKNHMERELKSAAEAGRRVALLFIDLDGFKAVNDTWSHRVGDIFLCEIANRLSRVAGTTQKVARLGGDEFTMLISDGKLTISRPALLSFAEEVLAAVCEPQEIEGRKCVVGASIGVGMFPDDAMNAERLIRAADRAMYEAKRTGKRKVCASGSRHDDKVPALPEVHLPRELECLDGALSRPSTRRNEPLEVPR